MKSILLNCKSFDKNNKYISKLMKKYELRFVNKPSNDVIGVIVGTETIDSNYLKKVPNLKVISRFGTGIDNIDIKEIENRNIKLYRTIEEPSISVAEYTVYLILNMLKHEMNTSHNLRNRTIGIIGYGNIGSKVAKLLEPFNCTIYRYDPPYCPVLSCHLNSILMFCDIITLHIPLNKDTYHFIDKNKIDRMEKKPIIINTSRANVVDEDAIRCGLHGGKISGFASDVNNWKKFIDCGNVYITEHIASSTIETLEAMTIKSVDNLIEGLYGKI